MAIYKLTQNSPTPPSFRGLDTRYEVPANYATMTAICKNNLGANKESVQ